MSSMERAVIVDALRTPIGRYGRALKEARPDDPASVLAREAARRAGRWAGRWITRGGAGGDPPSRRERPAGGGARRYGITREAQDEWALGSHRKAVAAQEACHFRNEMVAVALADGVKIEKDEGPRPDTSLEKLASLKPAFEKDGTVTAGNSSPLNDGAACLGLMAESHAQRIGARPLARILAAASAGGDPP